MKTTSELIAEVEAELNAVKAADMGLEAAEAFAGYARDSFAAGDVVKTKEALDNLISLLSALRPAVPANVTPASAGPVGKSPKEQYLDEAQGIVQDALGKLQTALGNVHGVLKGISEAVDQATTATAAINGAPKE